MSFRRVLPVVVLVSLLLSAPVSATTRNVTIVDYSFGPSAITATLGDEVAWKNNGAHEHTSTRATFPSWSIDLTIGDSGNQVFLQAGTFPYACSIHHSMHGTVKVPVQATPSSGGVSTTFTIRVASVDAAAGSTYVIQRKAPGGAFKTWKTTARATVTFKSSVTGRWTFRSQVKKLSNSQGSAFSPSASVTIG